jgi:ankyrin repeat protein
MMRYSVLIGCLLVAPTVATAQEKGDPDGSEDVLKDLAKHFKDDRTIQQIKRDNALIRAARNGDTDGIRKALKEGALINSRYLDGYAFLDEGTTGYTALMLAVLNKQTEAIKLLIENKADLEVKHHEGWTALYLAVQRKNEEAVELLVKSGAKQDPAKLRLARELIKAACKGFDSRPNEPFPPDPGGPVGDTSKYPDIVAVLKKGADVNMTDPKGYTALMYAANLGLVDNVKTLLANGADATLKSVDGNSALSLVDSEDPLFRLEERRQVRKVLKEHLAKKR